MSVESTRLSVNRRTTEANFKDIHRVAVRQMYVYLGIRISRQVQVNYLPFFNTKCTWQSVTAGEVKSSQNSQLGIYPSVGLCFVAVDDVARQLRLGIQLG